ncbi:50S ribosomal protein L6 [bacterium]|jgi:large subunit ribosomal protein L6|nr:50S ribosomal protein L6 [bacterium]MBT3581160.1 50S ribosomal protein L6 [bacterium]MBT4551593.1 50S ribosomal protein L6 [bacterium]MBT5988888.1 50S ribosomal protein L6 [bacterium]MBT7087805.1 50S ribosomal protein L6 [bacterium]
MSRIGKRKLKYSEKIKITLEKDLLTVSGPKGVLSQKINPEITVEIDAEQRIIGFVTMSSCEKKVKSLHGLYGSLVNNMIQGVDKGFEKVLELVGVGYKVQKAQNGVVFNLGYSHPIEFKTPEGIAIIPEGVTKVKVQGIDKCLVGQVAAEIRKLRKVEPYKGKGVKYAGEIVRRKAGKSVK